MKAARHHLPVFLAGTVFLGAAALALFWPLGAPFFGPAPFFEEGLSGATAAPCAVTAAVSVGSTFVMVVFVILSARASRMTIHRSQDATKQVESARRGVSTLLMSVPPIEGRRQNNPDGGINRERQPGPSTTTPARRWAFVSSTLPLENSITGEKFVVDLHFTQ